MAVQQQPSQSYFSIFRTTAYPFIQQKVLGRHLLPNGQWATSSQKTSLADLDDYCFANIFRCLSLRDLTRLRRVSRRLHFSVGEYLDTRRHFVYSCEENGVKLDQNGHYRFNLAAFEFALANQPNLRSLAFERCSVMRHTMATCNQDIIEKITSLLYDLKMLQLPRSLAITPKAIDRLLSVFPELSHLTLTIFSEELLGAVVDGLKHLKYLNLADSLLYDYAPILKRLPPTIRTFIAPADMKDSKAAILEALCLGFGRRLERLEVKISIHDLAADAEWFKKLGCELRRLKWFQAEFSSNLRNRCGSTSLVANGSSETGDQQSKTISRQNSKDSPPKESSRNRTRPTYLLRGLSGLKSLRVLVLKEADFFASEGQLRNTLFDDESLLAIFRSCGTNLEALTICVGLRRNSPTYHRCEFESRDNAVEVNRILASVFAEDQLEDEIVPKTGTRRQSLLEASRSSSFSSSFEKPYPPPPMTRNQRSSSLSFNVKTKPAFTRNVSIFGDMFEAQEEEEDSPNECSDGEQNSLDSGVSDLGCSQEINRDSSKPSEPSSVTDCCLATLHLHLPKLRILQLRGVRLGLKSMDSIASLKSLELLRLDSISFNGTGARDAFTDFIGRLTNSGNSSTSLPANPKTNIRITNIPLV